MTLLQAAVALRDQFHAKGVSVEVQPEGDALLVVTSDPSAAIRIAPVRFEGFVVRLRKAETGMAPRPTMTAVRVAEGVELLPARRPAEAVVRAAPTGLAEIDEDRRLWEAIEGVGDPLGEMSFDQAVRIAPLRIEALVHQRVHRAFHAIYGLGPGGMGPAGMGGLQAETYRLRNGTLREVHGRVTASAIADSLLRNWEDYSGILVGQCRMAERAGQRAAFTRFFAAHLPDLRRAFTEARAIALRASEATGEEQDQEAWRNVATAMRAMGDFTVDLLSGAPLPAELPGGRQHALGNPPRQIGAAPRRLGVRDEDFGANPTGPRLNESPIGSGYRKDSGSRSWSVADDLIGSVEAWLIPVSVLSGREPSASELHQARLAHDAGRDPYPTGGDVPVGVYRVVVREGAGRPALLEERLQVLKPSEYRLFREGGQFGWALNGERMILQVPTRGFGPTWIWRGLRYPE